MSPPWSNAFKRSERWTPCYDRLQTWLAPLPYMGYPASPAVRMLGVLSRAVCAFIATSPESVEVISRSLLDLGRIAERAHNAM
jgi:hypothetical protein